MFDFSGLGPALGRNSCEKELRIYCAQHCTTRLEIMSYAGPGVIVDYKDPYLLEWVFRLSNTSQANGHTTKVEEHRLRLKAEDIYALAYEDVSKRGPLERLNGGGKTMVTYTHRPSPEKTALNAVNADATMTPNTAKPTDNSVNAEGHPKPTAKKNADPSSSSPASRLPPSNQPVWVPCSKYRKTTKQTDMEYRIDCNVTDGTFGVCKTDSPCNDSHWAVPQSNDWAVKGGSPKGGKPKGGGGDMGGRGNKGGKGAPYGRGRW